MAMAKPIVVTPDAMAGIDCSNDAACIVQRPGEMATEIASLLNDCDRRGAMGAAGGAAIGALAGSPGMGAAIGAGAGLLGGYLYDQKKKGNID